jgi:hypothetical protein
MDSPPSLKATLVVTTPLFAVASLWIASGKLLATCADEPHAVAHRGTASAATPAYVTFTKERSAARNDPM